MGVILFLGFAAGFLGVCIFGALSIVHKSDLTKRRRWNGWVLRSLALGLISIAPFVLGIRALTAMP